jgi:non-canonical (house-cleaning) NTP pyrophosphatase
MQKLLEFPSGTEEIEKVARQRATEACRAPLNVSR